TDTSPPRSGASTGTAVSSVEPTQGPSGPSTDPPTDTVPPESPSPSESPATVQAVLSDVHVVGSPPAWSSDGETLAFSAMPADRSRGPDIYTWRLGDVSAKRLTRDHASYFASWSGARIVVSRAIEALAPGGGRSLVARTVVIDVRSGEQRLAALEGLWLPYVDPTSRFAVAWQGDLTRAGRSIVPDRGALYLLAWRRIDPFVARRTKPEPSESPDASGDGRGTGPLPTDEPQGAVPSTAPVAGSPIASPTDRRPRNGGNGRNTPPPGTVPTPEPTPQPTPVVTEALEPDRDIDVNPVREWRVGWSDDGSAFGFWVTETPGATWGRLAVYQVDASDIRVDRRNELLSPTLARRAFSLGLERVVWVGSSDSEPDGELRLRTWGARGVGGSRGFGGLRIRDIELKGGFPAF
ncbi:MAG: hypothetical protein ABIZ34_06605, partial [Candidatus Limnocylindrales bacterium]